MAATSELVTTLSPQELQQTDAYWRACNYLSAGMIYLRANPLLREPLKPSKQRKSPVETGPSLMGGNIPMGCDVANPSRRVVESHNLQSAIDRRVML